jgi:uncharacterized cupin superfamily protein
MRNRCRGLGWDDVAVNPAGVAELLEPDNPGMHTTNSVDYLVVLDGDLWLELDDGQLTRLGPGDITRFA